MKRLFIIILVMGVCFPDSWAQDEITEENYLRQDSILWDCYYKREAELGRLWKELPEEKHDSLRQIYQKTLDDALRENARLAIRFASVPSGLRRLYMVRDDVCKDTLQHILNTLTPEMRHSFYGKNIQSIFRAIRSSRAIPCRRFLVHKPMVCRSIGLCCTVSECCCFAMVWVVWEKPDVLISTVFMPLLRERIF